MAVLSVVRLYQLIQPLHLSTFPKVDTVSITFESTYSFITSIVYIQSATGTKCNNSYTYKNPTSVS